jgi:hypothetical protein
MTPNSILSYLAKKDIDILNKKFLCDETINVNSDI